MYSHNYVSDRATILINIAILVYICPSELFNNVTVPEEIKIWCQGEENKVIYVSCFQINT